MSAQSSPVRPLPAVPAGNCYAAGCVRASVMVACARWLGAAQLALLATLLVACAAPPPPPPPAAPVLQTRVVLLPQEGGAPSAVVVRTDAGEQVLDAPYHRATVPQDGRSAATVDQADAQAVQARFPGLFALRPPPPRQFVVHFATGGTVLTPESRQLLQQALDEAARRSGAGLVIVGHTDSMGRQAANDALSLERAQWVRAMFLERGVPGDRIEAAGRGSRDPAVPTPDQVNEPRNRRVTIEVR
jgi:OOP family OmpA-OmpF porin